MDKINGSEFKRKYNNIIDVEIRLGQKKMTRNGKKWHQF